MALYIVKNMISLQLIAIGFRGDTPFFCAYAQYPPLVFLNLLSGILVSTPFMSINNHKPAIGAILRLDLGKLNIIFEHKQCVF